MSEILHWLWSFLPTKFMAFLAKKQTNHVLVFILLTPTWKSFFHTLSGTSKRKYFISWIYKKCLCSITFSYSHDCQKSGKKIQFFKDFIFLTWLDLTWRKSFFVCFFPRRTQNQRRSTRHPAIEQRHDQHEVKHVWSIGVL